MNFLTRVLVGIAVLIISASVGAQESTQLPEVVIQNNGDFTNILTTTPSFKRQSALLEAILKLPPDLDTETIHWIEESSNYLPPAFLYELSRRLLATDTDAAMEWFAVANVRSLYDAFRCADVSARRGIRWLSVIAKDVIKYGRDHRGEFGRAGLRAFARSDLFTDHVSPIWICIRGMDAVQAGLDERPLTKEEWLVPEKDWPEIRQKLLAALTEYYHQQSVPQIDPVPATKLRFAVYGLQEDFQLKRYAWLTGQELVVGIYNGSKDSRDSRDLFLWRPGSMENMREIVRGKFTWCAGRSNVMYETGRRTPEEGVIELTYQFGAIHNTTERRLRAKGSLTFAEQVKNGDIRGYDYRSPYQQSPFNCQWVKKPRLSDQSHDRWLPLLENDGFLAFHFSNKTLTGTEPSLRYAKNQEDEGQTLPIKWNPVLPKCVHYYDFKKAYFLSPCGMNRKNHDDIKKLKCIPYWWLRKKEEGMKLEENCLPVDSVSENLPILFPSRVGMLRLVSYRTTFHGEKSGGVYLTEPDGKVTKIYDTWIFDSLMSPDGCLLALRHAPTGDYSKMGISVIDVCSAQPLAKQ